MAVSNRFKECSTMFALCCPYSVLYYTLFCLNQITKQAKLSYVWCCFIDVPMWPKRPDNAAFYWLNRTTTWANHYTSQLWVQQLSSLFQECICVNKAAAWKSLQIPKGIKKRSIWPSLHLTANPGGEESIRPESDERALSAFSVWRCGRSKRQHQQHLCATVFVALFCWIRKDHAVVSSSSK